MDLIFGIKHLVEPRQSYTIYGYQAITQFSMLRLTQLLSMCRCRVVSFLIFMPPTSKKLRGHIGLGLSLQ